MFEKHSLKIWYVYLLCDPDTEIPFYVGKGTGDRIDDHERFVNSRWHAVNERKNNIIRGILAKGKHVLKKKIAEFESEEDAYAYETEMIAFYSAHIVNISLRGGGKLSKTEEKLAIRSRPHVQMQNTRYLLPEEPIGAEEAAKMLGVTSRTVIKLAERGEIPAFRVGKLWKFYPSDIRAYIDRQRRGNDDPDR